MAKRLFEKGKSGNPSGRPKEAFHIRDLARENCPKALATIVALMDSKDEDIKLKASAAILDRGFGKPIQDIRGSGLESTRIQVFQNLGEEAIPVEERISRIESALRNQPTENIK